MAYQEPSKESAHRKFWEHIKAGGRVWRDDPLNKEQEFLDLERLGGDANEIQGFGYNDLTIQQVPSTNIDQILCQMLEGKRVEVAEREAVISHVRERLAAGEKGDDLPIAMEALGCDYDAACNVVVAGNKEAALSLVAAALSNPKGASLSM